MPNKNHIKQRASITSIEEAFALAHESARIAKSAEAAAKQASGALMRAEQRIRDVLECRDQLDVAVHRLARALGGIEDALRAIAESDEGDAKDAKGDAT